MKTLTTEQYQSNFDKVAGLPCISIFPENSEEFLVDVESKVNEEYRKNAIAPTDWYSADD